MTDNHTQHEGRLASSGDKPHPNDAHKPVVEVMDDAMADILRTKTEVERLQIAGRMWKSARTILRGAIRTEHPEWDTEQVNREIAQRISHGAVDFESC